jgi:hypothetical protein
MHPDALCSLNHDTIIPLGVTQTRTFQKIYPHHKWWRVYPYTHPLHTKVLKHFLYIWWGCGMQSMVAWSLNHDVTTSLGLGPTPNFQKIHPHYKWRISVRVHLYPSTAYQSAKTLSIYLWCGCGMQSTVVWSLNHDITSSLGLEPTPIFKTIHPYLKWGISVIGCTHMPIHCIQRC